MLNQLVDKMRDIIDLGGKQDSGTEGAGTSAEAVVVDPVPEEVDGTEAARDVQAEDVRAQAETPLTRKAADELHTESAIPQADLERITGDVIKGLKSVYDPEIPVDIYELGLIYKVDLSDERLLTIDMTLTAPGCPVAGEMPGWVEGSVRGIEGVEDVKVNMVFEPPWTPERMSDEAKLELGWM